MTAGWFLYTNVCWRLLFIISRVWQLVFLSSAGCSSSPSAKQTTKKIAYTAAEDSNSIEGYCSLTPAICRKLSLSLSKDWNTNNKNLVCNPSTIWFAVRMGDDVLYTGFCFWLLYRHPHERQRIQVLFYRWVMYGNSHERAANPGETNHE